MMKLLCLKRKIIRRNISLCLFFFLATVTFVLWPWVNTYQSQTGVDVMERPRGDNRGFQQVTSDGSLHAYSAYFDPREDPQLRIFVMCTQPFINISYICKVKLKTGEIHHVPGSFFIFFNWLTYKYKYVSGVVKCQLLTCCEEEENLQSVSLFPLVKDLRRFQDNFTIPLNDLTIRKHELTILFPGQHRTNSLTRCIAPLHNYSKPQKLIWSMEISRLSGVDKFIFYNYSISVEVDRVIRHYMKAWDVEVRVWNIPKAFIYYFGQMLAEHDCLMSEMFSAKYVLLTDIDEIILPHNGLSVVQMADTFFEYESMIPKSNLGSLAFRSLCFIRNTTDDIPDNWHEKLEAKRLQIEPLLFTTYYNPTANSRKVLVIPERTDRVCVHNACFLTKTFKEKLLKPNEEAAMLHYRDKPNHMGKNPTFHQFYGLQKYSREIIAAVSERIKLVKI